MRRFALVLVVLSGCGGRAASSEPAWPRSAGWVTPEDWKDDGGESLEPQVPASVAAIERSSEPAAAVTIDLGSGVDVIEFAPDLDLDQLMRDALELDDDVVPGETITIEDDDDLEP